MGYLKEMLLEKAKEMKEHADNIPQFEIALSELLNTIVDEIEKHEDHLKQLKDYLLDHNHHFRPAMGLTGKSESYYKIDF